MPLKILVKEAPDANLKPAFVKKSMKTIVDGQYWGDPAKIKDGSFTFGTNDVEGGPAVLSTSSLEEDAYTDSHDKVVHDRSAGQGSRHRRVPEIIGFERVGL